MVEAETKKERVVSFHLDYIGGPVSRTDIIPKLRYLYLVVVNTHKVLLLLLSTAVDCYSIPRTL